MLSRTSSSLLSSASSSSSLVARACFSTSSASSQRTKDGPSTMGVGRKARVGAHYHKDGGGVVQFQGHRTPKKGTVDKPHLEGGHLSKSHLEDLIGLYHSSQFHVNRDNLDAVIDAAFSPSIDAPRLARPLMASLEDLHAEMNDPGSLTRPAFSASTHTNDAPANYALKQRENALRTAVGTTPPSHLAAARQEALERLHSDPNSPAADPRASADAAILAGISPIQSASHAPPSSSRWLADVDENRHINDWVGAPESDMSPRERALVQALYGVEENNRPGLGMVTDDAKRLKVERERAKLEMSRLEYEELRKEIEEDRAWREEQEARSVEEDEQKRVE